MTHPHDPHLFGPPWWTFDRLHKAHKGQISTVWSHDLGEKLTFWHFTYFNEPE